MKSIAVIPSKIRNPTVLESIGSESETFKYGDQICAEIAPSYYILPVSMYAGPFGASETK